MKTGNWNISLVSTQNSVLFSILFVGSIFTMSLIPNSFALDVFYDDFQSGFSKWTETGEGDWNLELPAEKQVPGHFSNLVAHSDDCDTSCTITMTNSIDLRSYSSATLTFWRYVDNDIDPKEYLRVDLFDGTKWNIIFNWKGGAGDDDEWHHETVNLANYLNVSNFKVRFVTYQSFYTEDVQIDDVKIDGVSSGPVLPNITISDITLTEGHSETTDFEFIITRSDNTNEVSVNYSTADDTAKMFEDYLQNSATITFAANGPLSQTITVPVNGDAIVEPDESFSVDLSNCLGCIISDDQGLGTIINDDFNPITFASPSGGTFDTTQSISLVSNVPATIYYTMDGSTPTTASNIYISPIQISSTTTLKFFAKDNTGNEESVKTEVYQIVLGLPIIHMSDTTVSTGQSIHSGRQMHAEYVSSSSQLVGDNIDKMTLKLKKSGSPTGTAQVGVFNADLSLKKLFATKDVSTLTGSYTDYSFILPDDQSYQIQVGDRIGIKYAGGDATTNNISIMRDTAAADPFDGVNSYHTYYTTSWVSATANDLYMILEGNSAKPDTTLPITTASPSGGTYTSALSVTLTANEPATIYYTTNGDMPTTLSTAYSAPIQITTNSSLKFFAKDTAGNEESVKTEEYLINTFSDIFGIVQIYPTTANGNTWFLNMNNPALDPRFDLVSSITQNTDGSWKIQNSSSVRMSVFSTDKDTYGNTLIPTLSRTQLASTGYMQLPSDWRNFEMTGYVKLNSGSLDDFTWYGRGGKHIDVNYGCEGSAYKAELSFDGGTRFAKESWHVHYDFTGKKSGTPSLLDKWVGFKFILFNKPGVNFAQQVQGEIWVDLQNNNNWVKVDSFVDDGWGSGAILCGPTISDNMPITWGGPIATFRVDNSDDFDFKYLSIREIESPH